jgi:hypothetical protein
MLASIFVTTTIALTRSCLRPLKCVANNLIRLEALILTEQGDPLFHPPLDLILLRVLTVVRGKPSGPNKGQREKPSQATTQTASMCSLQTHWS